MSIMKRFLRDNGLSLSMFILFVLVWIGQFFTGLHSMNEDLKLHERAQMGAIEYLGSGHFWESTFENWESEFFQMSLFVFMTAFLYQRGSSESKPLPDEKDEKNEKKSFPPRYFVGRPLLRTLYENSLSLALFFLFLISFAGHLLGGWKEENLRRAISPAARPPISVIEFLESSDFWFQSLQNWQSEFLSVGIVVIFSIFLRQKGSSQSKEVDAPHFQTGD